MLTYYFKASFCLFVFYGVYHLFLRREKVLEFNRFYLLFSLVLSLTIPLIVIPVSPGFIPGHSLDRFILPSADWMVPVSTAGSEHSPVTVLLIAALLFILGSSVLAMRLVIHLIQLAGKVFTGTKVPYGKSMLILRPEKTLPYSFFGYIFVNCADYRKGNIGRELLLHEIAHVRKCHSADRILIEILIVFFWFHPAIWWFRKSILLNHEYGADLEVTRLSDAGSYQQLLLTVLMDNRSGILVSNFKNSFIKNRIIMMNKNNPGHRALYRKAAGILVLLGLGASLTFSRQEMFHTGALHIEKAGIWITAGPEKPSLFPVKDTDRSEISRNFGVKFNNPLTKKMRVHSGIDIKAAKGTDVLAAGGGKVVRAFLNGAFGNTIIIDHGDGYQSFYAHLEDMDVKDGEAVTKGQTIGHVGSTGYSTGPHLHFEISLHGKRIDPVTLLK